VDLPAELVTSEVAQIAGAGRNTNGRRFINRLR
jgi:hypothetical protein